VSDERRGSRRYPPNAPVPVRLRLEGEELSGLLRDICREAALVEAPRELPLETSLSLLMDLPIAGGPLQVSGRVVRRTEPEGDVHPLAILFSGLTPAAATQIDLYLAQLEQKG
jgi:hypothetical protein